MNEHEAELESGPCEFNSGLYSKLLSSSRSKILESALAANIGSVCHRLTAAVVIPILVV